MKKDKLSYILGFLLISSSYLLLSYWIQLRGFYNLESYFFEYKTQVITRFDSEFLRTFYFTQPGFLFIISLPFTYLWKIQGIYILNAFLIGGLTNHLFFKSIKGNPIHKSFLVYLFFSPVIVYSATSGGSLAIYLIFYFLYFSLIMKYANSLSVFHLTLLSLLVGMHVLMNGPFVKLILIAIPIFFFSGFYKAKGISGNFFNRASAIFRNASQRRKFFSEFFASVLILTFIPCVGYLIFLIINKVFAGDYHFSERSLGDSWQSYSSLLHLTSETPYIWEVLSGSSIFYLISIILIGSVAVLQLFKYDNSVSTRIAIGIILLFVLSEVLTSKITNLNLTLLSMLTGTGLASLYFSESTKSSLKSSAKFIPFLIPFLAIFFEYNYFENSIVKAERLYFDVSHNAAKNRIAESLNQSIAVFNHNGGGHVLADDAIFYPELSQLSSEFTWNGHFSPQFISALQQPELYADYLIVTKEAHPLHLYDFVATALKRLESFNAKVDYQVLYEDELIQILSIKK
jgi:hypothetical protein